MPTHVRIKKCVQIESTDESDMVTRTISRELEVEDYSQVRKLCQCSHYRRHIWPVVTISQCEGWGGGCVIFSERERERRSRETDERCMRESGWALEGYGQERKASPCPFGLVYYSRVSQEDCETLAARCLSSLLLLLYITMETCRQTTYDITSQSRLSCKENVSYKRWRSPINLNFLRLIFFNSICKVDDSEDDEFVQRR